MTVKTMKEVKRELQSAIKYLEYAKIAVNVYVSYDVDVDTGEEFAEYTVIVDCYEGDSCSDDYFEQQTYKTEKEAMKRAKSVLRTVKDWLEFDDAEVREEIKVITP